MVSNNFVAREVDIFFQVFTPQTNFPGSAPTPIVGRVFPAFPARMLSALILRFLILPLRFLGQT